MITDLTFSDWDHYTDGNGTPRVLDWSSAAAMRGRPAYPYLEALRQALAERHAIGGGANPEAIPGPVTSRQLNTSWGRRVMEAAIMGLRSHATVLGYASHGSVIWVRPSEVTTMHNVPDPIETGLSGKLYGGWFSGDVRLAALEAQLNDAAITDTAFRAWWMSHSTDMFGETVTDQVAYTTPWRNAEVIRNCKQILSLHTKVLVAHTDMPWNSDNIFTVTGTDYREAHGFYYRIPWDDVVTAFNGRSWATTAGTTWGNWNGRASHVGADFGYEDFIDWSFDGPICLRTRVATAWTLPAVNCNAEFAARIGCEDVGRNADYVEPHFKPVDFSGITAVGTTPPPYQAWCQFGTRTGVSGTQTFTYGDFGDNALPDPNGAGEIKEGWVASQYGVLLDFAVPGGFVFR